MEIQGLRWGTRVRRGLGQDFPRGIPKDISGDSGDSVGGNGSLSPERRAEVLVWLRSESRGGEGLRWTVLGLC